MNYYDDLEIPFVSYVKDGHCRSHIPLYYGIQYNHAGTVLLRIDDGPVFRGEGPHVFFSHPGAFFEYSPPPGMNAPSFFDTYALMPDSTIEFAS